VKKLRDADALLAAGKSIGEVLQTLEMLLQPIRYKSFITRLISDPAF
jgi:hypothetical protein